MNFIYWKFMHQKIFTYLAMPQKTFFFLVLWAAVAIIATSGKENHKPRKDELGGRISAMRFLVAVNCTWEQYVVYRFLNIFMQSTFTSQLL